MAGITKCCDNTNIRHTIRTNMFQVILSVMLYNCALNFTGYPKGTPPLLMKQYFHVLFLNDTATCLAGEGSSDNHMFIMIIAFFILYHLLKL